VTTPLDLAFVALLAVAWPIHEYWFGWPAFQRRLRDDPGRARRREYRGTVIRQWLLVAVGAVLWSRAGRTWSSLALTPPEGLSLGFSAVVLVLIGAAYASQARKAARSADVRARLRKAFAPLEGILPHTQAELAWFLVTSLTAGFCEEFLFRGYVVWTLAPWLGWWGAAALSTVAFGFLHAYQGGRGIVRTAAVGAVMVLVVAGTRSLVPAMALHALIDVGAGIVTWIALREVVPAG